MGIYVRPTVLSDALACRAAGADILAGGTDFWPVRVGQTAYASAGSSLLDLSQLSDLRGITTSDAGLRIGALTTWTELAETQLPSALVALQIAAREVGGRQIQNRGTIGGNLCNASPAADGVPPLLALDASVELSSATSVRTMLLSEFLIAPRRTKLQSNELLTAVLVPSPQRAARSHFIKLGARKYQLISIVMGAAVLSVKDGVVTQAAIAVGSCSPVAQRLHKLERALQGVAGHAVASLVTAQHLVDLSPIDDIRADAAYRAETALVVVHRLLAHLAGDA